MKIQRTINVDFKDNYLQLNDLCFSRSSVREDNHAKANIYSHIRRRTLSALPGFYLRRNLQYIREHKHERDAFGPDKRLLRYRQAALIAVKKIIANRNCDCRSRFDWETRENRELETRDSALCIIYSVEYVCISRPPSITFSSQINTRRIDKSR